MGSAELKKIHGLIESPDLIPLSACTIGEISAFLANESLCGEPFRAKQLFQAIQNSASTFDEITVLPLETRNKLKERFTLRCTRQSAVLPDSESTKLRLTLSDGAFIEAVLLRDGRGRKTACLSTQAGCPLACAFCATGALGFLRNLIAAEIIEQYHHLGTLNPGEKISNIVFMGMGEPLLNLDALEKAINIFSFSQRRITISTAGIINGIYDLCKRKIDARLAVSITAARPDLREKLMPITKSNPIPQLKEALLFYQSKKSKRITLETVLLKGINTGKEDAIALKNFAQGLNVLVNLIPFNSGAPSGSLQGRTFSAPGLKETLGFKTALESLGLKTVLRRSKGRSINGACGQLGGTRTRLDANFE